MGQPHSKRPRGVSETTQGVGMYPHQPLPSAVLFANHLLAETLHNIDSSTLNTTGTLAFHKTCGKNIMLSDSNKIARRKDGEENGALVFSSQVVGVNKKISVMINKTQQQNNAGGFLRLGYFHDEERRLGALCCLPSTLPDLVAEGNAWGCELSAELAEEGNIITVELTTKGTVNLYLNGVHISEWFQGVNTRKDLHFVADVYGGTKEIKMTGFPVEAYGKKAQIHDELFAERIMNKELQNFLKLKDLSIKSGFNPNLSFFVPSRTHLTMSRENTVATLNRPGGVCNNLIFIDNMPLKNGMSLMFDVIKGGFQIGFTTLDPREVSDTELPVTDDVLLNRSEYAGILDDFSVSEMECAFHFAISLDNFAKLSFTQGKNDNCQSKERTYDVDDALPLHLFFILKSPGASVRAIASLTHVEELPEGVTQSMIREHMTAESKLKKNEQSTERLADIYEKKEQMLIRWDEEWERTVYSEANQPSYTGELQQLSTSETAEDRTNRGRLQKVVNTPVVASHASLAAALLPPSDSMCARESTTQTPVIDRSQSYAHPKQNSQHWNEFSSLPAMPTNFSTSDFKSVSKEAGTPCRSPQTSVRIKRSEELDGHERNLRQNSSFPSLNVSSEDTTSLSCISQASVCTGQEQKPHMWEAPSHTLQHYPSVPNMAFLSTDFQRISTESPTHSMVESYRPGSFLTLDQPPQQNAHILPNLSTPLQNTYYNTKQVNQLQRSSNEPSIVPGSLLTLPQYQSGPSHHLLTIPKQFNNFTSTRHSNSSQVNQPENNSNQGVPLLTMQQHHINPQYRSMCHTLATTDFSNLTQIKHSQQSSDNEKGIPGSLEIMSQANPQCQPMTVSKLLNFDPSVSLPAPTQVNQLQQSNSDNKIVPGLRMQQPQKNPTYQSITVPKQANFNTSSACSQQRSIQVHQIQQINEQKTTQPQTYSPYRTDTVPKQPNFHNTLTHLPPNSIHIHQPQQNNRAINHSTGSLLTMPQTPPYHPITVPKQPSNTQDPSTNAQPNFTLESLDASTVPKQTGSLYQQRGFSATLLSTDQQFSSLNSYSSITDPKQVIQENLPIQESSSSPEQNECNSFVSNLKYPEDSITHVIEGTHVSHSNQYTAKDCTDHEIWESHRSAPENKDCKSELSDKAFCSLPIDMTNQETQDNVILPCSVAQPSSSIFSSMTEENAMTSHQEQPEQSVTDTEVGQTRSLNKSIENSVNECSICWDQRKNTLVMPCKHLCLCYECGEKVLQKKKECPICRSKISEIIKVFM